MWGVDCDAHAQSEALFHLATCSCALLSQVETRGATSPSKAAEAAATTAGAGAGAGAGSSAAAAGPRKRLGIPFAELEQRATLGTGTFGRVRA